MSLLVREVLQRLPKTIEWVFTKANGTRILPSGDFSSPRTIIGLPVGSSEVWRGDGAAERAGLENRRWGNPSASSNLAPSATYQ